MFGQAIALDPSLPDAHVALAVVNAWRGSWLAADSSFRTALQIGPSDAITHTNHALFVFDSAGHMREGLEEWRTAYALAPAAPGLNMSLGLSTR